MDGGGEGEGACCECVGGGGGGRGGCGVNAECVDGFSRISLGNGRGNDVNDRNEFI